MKNLTIKTYKSNIDFCVDGEWITVDIAPDFAGYELYQTLEEWIDDVIDEQFGGVILTPESFEEIVSTLRIYCNHYFA